MTNKASQSEKYEFKKNANPIHCCPCPDQWFSRRIMYYIHGVFRRAAREKAIKETYFVAMQETSSKLLVLTIRWIVRSFLRLTLREPLYCSSSVSMGVCTKKKRKKEKNLP
ncbi:hypothetical protein BT96DRAFT_640220 [Gymnopus androsaceus JB14]|uniref:Uncharacterized protein n=1 Tax=Gymnopus androsaceus JB14 TaxID=1447944 RepID=A0A6A4HNZ7_9AGAR|nr:hypothetical protein BT96DRAFT_640220 [Gymnopus androsaceus JB14]